MPINVETFLSLPDLATNFKNLKKEDLTALAQHFEIAVMNMKKDEIRTLVENRLVDDGLLEAGSESDEDASKEEQDTTTNGEQMLKMQLEMKKLELQAKK